MKILQIHNRYNIFGGEDTAVEEEALLLRSNKHEVYQIIRNNKIELNNFFKKIIVLKNLSYSNKSVNLLKKHISKYGKPDIVHVHNTFPLWTYSIFKYLDDINIPVVLSLHNFRIIFDKISLFDREFHKYGLFKNSKILTLIVSKLFNKNKQYLDKINKFITHTEFTKKIFLTHGVKNNKLAIKPNFVQNSLNKIKSIKHKKNAIFASRLSKEKGILTLINSWQQLKINLDILGDGPLFNKLNKKHLNIKYHRSLSRFKVNKHINKSKFLIYPSECYETFGTTIVEAFNEGTLVLASNIGSIKSIIKDKYNGLLFNPGDQKDLIRKVKWILKNPNKCDQIAQNAKKEFNKKYSTNSNYNQLINIYKDAINNKKKS